MVSALNMLVNDSRAQEECFFGLPIKRRTMAASLPAVEPSTLGGEVAFARDGGCGSDQVVGLGKPLLRNSQHFATAGSDRKV